MAQLPRTWWGPLSSSSSSSFILPLSKISFCMFMVMIWSSWSYVFLEPLQEIQISVIKNIKQQKKHHHHEQQCCIFISVTRIFSLWMVVLLSLFEQLKLCNKLLLNVLWRTCFVLALTKIKNILCITHNTCCRSSSARLERNVNWSLWRQHQRKYTECTLGWRGKNKDWFRFWYYQTVTSLKNSNCNFSHKLLQKKKNTY